MASSSSIITPVRVRDSQLDHSSKRQKRANFVSIPSVPERPAWMGTSMWCWGPVPMSNSIGKAIIYPTRAINAIRRLLNSAAYCKLVVGAVKTLHAGTGRRDFGALKHNNDLQPLQLLRICFSRAVKLRNTIEPHSQRSTQLYFLFLRIRTVNSSPQPSTNTPVDGRSVNRRETYESAYSNALSFSRRQIIGKKDKHNCWS